MLMKESRGEKYGRNLTIWINYTINTIPEEERADYKTRFMAELKKYSLEPRKKGEPKNRGCVWELDDLSEVNIRNPEELAKLIKEGIHLTYLKTSTSARIMKGLLDNL